MKKLISMMHMSLDGYVAASNGDFSWVKVDEELFDFGKTLTDEADAGVYGRITFDMMDSYWPTAGDQPDASRHDKDHSRWYKSVEKIVLSRTLESNPTNKVNVIHTTDTMYDIKKSGTGTMIIFGSPTATRVFNKARLIDDFWLFINPILLGGGNRLFSDADEMLPL